MADREVLQDWVLEALREAGGSADVLEVSKSIWGDHEADLRAAGDLFYTWQYDVRWAATKLRHAGRLQDAKASPRGVWVLATRSSNGSKPEDDGNV